MKTMLVKNLPSEERLVYWIKERHAIYLKKVAGKPKPWTDDKILQKFKFCNVRRRDDRVSKWLIENWYEPFMDHKNMLVACTLARQMNNTDTLEEIGFPDDWDPEKVVRVIAGRRQRGLRSYSSAYMITSNYGLRGREPQPKEYQTAYTVCQPIYESGIRVAGEFLQDEWERLLGFMGFSSFIAGQVVCDLRWGINGRWLDRKDWAPAGPGSKRGINRLLERDLNTPVSQKDFEEELKRVRRIVSTLKPGKDRPKDMEGIDYQSCLCEYDKYERTLWGEGRPKNLYPGV